MKPWLFASVANECRRQRRHSLATIANNHGFISPPALNRPKREDIVALETDIKYEGYLRQQDREVEKLRKAESKRIPEDLDYGTMPGLSREMVEKLSRVRPQSIAQASRIPGMTPAAISILLFHLEMRKKPQPENVV